jgi:hypothetical protein
MTSPGSSTRRTDLPISPPGVCSVVRESPRRLLVGVSASLGYPMVRRTASATEEHGPIDAVGEPVQEQVLPQSWSLALGTAEGREGVCPGAPALLRPTGLTAAARTTHRG